MNGPEMDPEATADAMTLLAAAGQHMGTGWGAITAELDGLVGQLGRGELGAAFLDGYRQPAGDTAKAVERCCQVPGRLAATGNECIGTYVSTDHRHGDHIKSLGATAPPATP